MKMYKWLLLLIPVLILSMLACRPVVRGEAPVSEAVQPLPAQVATPTPTPTATPMPTPTVAATPVPTPTAQATPTPTPSLPYTILTPEPGVDRSRPPPPPPPVQNLTQFPPPKTAEEADAQMQQRLRELGVGPTVKREVSGPSTMGAKVHVGKTTIQLPDDAYIQYVIMSSNCTMGKPCPQTPQYGIMRGKSSIGFSAVDGEIIGEDIATGESGAFDFLKDYLRKKKTEPPAAALSAAPVPAQATGPATRGATIQVSGKNIKLPDDAFVDAIIVSVYRFDGERIPKPPIYRIVRSKSMIAVSAVDGQIAMGLPAPGEMALFYSLLNLFEAKIP